MKPYDKSNSFMRRVTKRVSELIPGTTWMNMLLGESQTGDDPSSSSEHDEQPPVKKLCTSNNTFTNVNNRTRVDTCPLTNSDDNHRHSNVNINLPEVSASTCLPSTSKQSPKFINQSSSSVCHDIGNKSSLKRKSDSVDLSNINRSSQKGIAFNFASSTPTLGSVNQQPMVLYNRENESQSLLKFRETTKPHVPSPSFRWDTFVNYGELSERQKLFAQKSPLNCSQVMYGGNSARSNLSKILGNSPAIHTKSTIPISPTKNSEIRTTSSILLSHISTKDKEIEENKFIIQPRIHLRHKAEQKIVPIKVETTINNVDTTPEKPDDTSNNISSVCIGRDSTRKLKANISKKARGLLTEEFEMPAKVDLPNISLPVPVLPCINLSNTNSEDNEFTFNQPLTLEQFSLQVAAKSCKKKQKTTLKKIQNSNADSCNKNQHLNFSVLSPSLSVTVNEVPIKETIKENASISSNNINAPLPSDKILETNQFGNLSKNALFKSVQNSVFKSDPIKSVDGILDNSIQTQNSNKKNPQQSDKLSVELKKWTCDTCWVSNDSDKINCIACQVAKPSVSEKPLLVTKVAGTWTCETCWVPNNKETDTCVACQTQKSSGTAKKPIEPNSNWTCDACWVKNKNDCTSCISCGTVKPGSVPEIKPQSSTQFKFGLNNNSNENSCGQFKFGFDTNINKSSQFKFGCPTTESNNSNTSTTEFKFGMVNNKSDQPLSTLKFGSDSTDNQSMKTPDKTLNSNNVKSPSNQFKFGFEKNTDQPETQFKFGLHSVTSKPIAKFKFGSESFEVEKPVQQICKTDDSKVTQSTNEIKKIVNNGNETSTNLAEIQNKCSPLKFGDTKPTEKSNTQFTFGSVKPNCNDLNSFANIGSITEDQSKDKFIWDKKDKSETKPINFSIPSTIQSSTGTTNTNQMVNGHSHSSEVFNEDQKPGLIKSSQLFSFGSLAKQDQNLSNDQNKSKPKTYTFGSVTNDNKSFVTPTLNTSSFPNTGSVFGASNSLFGNGPTTSTSTALGSSVLKPQFSFGSMAPGSDSFFSKTTKDNDKPSAQTSNCLNSTPKVGFSFDAQQSPSFSVANNTGLFTKSIIQADDQPKSISNNIFNSSSTKSSVKLDPNAPISINFTGGATTQFTAKPETTEPSTKRKILKPVRRIR